MLGRCLVTAIRRGKFDIITVVLGSDTKSIRTQDSIKLIEYTYANFEQVDIGKMAREKFENWSKANPDRIHVNKGIEDYVISKLGEQKHSMFPINKNDIKNLNLEIDSVTSIEAPILENDILRQARYTHK